MINGEHSVTGGPHVNGALTIRVYMATQFMAAQMPVFWKMVEEDEPIERSKAVICKTAVIMADALIEELNQEKEPPKKL